MTTSTRGSADQQSRLWGARPRDWAHNEVQQQPVYEEALRRTGIGAGYRVLEVGCGTGVFLRAAADRGARVSGLDAADPLLAVARERVPEADLRSGDLQFLPYDDDSFDLVAGFNSFFFAADMVAALREAGRVAKPGAPVVIQVWGRPERCGLTTYLAALAPLRDAERPAGPALWEPGVLEQMATAAGLQPEEAFDVVCPWNARDDDELTGALLAPGPVTALVREHGEEPVRRVLVDSMAPYRTSTGSYALTNEWHFLIARA